MLSSIVLRLSFHLLLEKGTLVLGNLTFFNFRNVNAQNYKWSIKLYTSHILLLLFSLCRLINPKNA